MSKEDAYSDFAVVDDGFRDITQNAETKLQFREIDAAPGDIIESRNANTSIDKIDVLIAQSGVTIDAALALSTITVDNLADVGHAIKTVTSPVVMQFPDIRVLREFVRRHGMFGVRIAALRNIPDVIKDRLYEQSVWDVTSVDYPILLERVKSIADADAAKRRKDEVKKRMDLRDKRRVTEESGTDESAQPVSRLGDDAVDDEDQFEG